MFHGTVNKRPVHDAYTVTIVEQSNIHSLDTCEDEWYHKLDSQINIQKHDLPTCEIFLVNVCVVL